MTINKVVCFSDSGSIGVSIKKGRDPVFNARRKVRKFGLKLCVHYQKKPTVSVGEIKHQSRNDDVYVHSSRLFAD